MPIRSELELEQLLREHFSLSPDDIAAMTETAIFDGGMLRGLYIRPLRRATADQMGAFFTAAGARMGQFGDVRGDRVYRDQIPGSGQPPCKPKDNWTCWVPHNDPWTPSN
jgi:hypothetical protein